MKYELVTFPEIQQFMTHPRWDECIFVNDEKLPDSSYMVPEDLYNEVGIEYSATVTGEVVGNLTYEVKFNLEDLRECKDIHDVRDIIFEKAYDLVDGEHLDISDWYSEIILPEIITNKYK